MVRGYGEDPNQPQKRDAVVDRTAGNKAPSAREVDEIHRNSDVDRRPEAQHHTLGYGPNQASPGDHNHRDGKSAKILDGITITGSKAGSNATLLGSVVAALVALGAKDSTT